MQKTTTKKINGRDEIKEDKKTYKIFVFVCVSVLIKKKYSVKRCEKNVVMENYTHIFSIKLKWKEIIQNLQEKLKQIMC